jgi:hypothetical protein
MDFESMYHDALYALDRLRAENARLAAELAALTPGGSEFHNSPDYCLQWIRERLTHRAKIAKERNELRAELAAARELIREAQDRLLKQDAYIALLEGRE